MTQALRIAVAEDERDTREYLQELLTRAGHQVVASENGRQLVEQCRLLGPDLVIADIRMPDMDGVQAAEAINRERETPVILVTGHHTPEFLSRAAAAPVQAYLIKPVEQADVEAAVAVAMRRFADHQAARAEARALKQTLEERKVIERAKGAVMRRLGIGEDDAFRRLRELASDQNRRLIEVAQSVLSADEVFRPME